MPIIGNLLISSHSKTSSSSSSGGVIDLLNKILKSGQTLSGKGVGPQNVCYKCGNKIKEQGVICNVNHHFEFCGQVCLTKHKESNHSSDIKE
jgi:hypothetical protein